MFPKVIISFTSKYSIREGFIYPYWEIFQISYLNNNEGNYLYGRINLEGKQFSVRPSNWYASKNFLASYIQNHRLPSRLSKDVGKVDIFTLNYYRGISYATGGNFVSLLQETETNIAPFQEFQEFMPDITSNIKV